MTTLHTWIPDFLKPVFRWFYYPQERAKVINERRVRKTQDEKIKQYDPSIKKLILFLIQGADYDTGVDKISGGIISIVSLCEESAKLNEVHHAQVLLVTLPGEYLLDKHIQFKNETDVFRYEQVENYFKNVSEITVHIPEFMSLFLLKLAVTGRLGWMKRIPAVHINILNQNVRLMPTPDEVNKLKEVASQITITTAHQQYCNQTFQDLYKVPLHKFSVWISPEKYYFKKYENKENLMIVSPDHHPKKELILNRLTSETNIKLQIIKNLTYEQYKETISRAKWTLTFGEGLDGYLIEPIFSGAIGFAVYNREFFTPDFEKLDTVYNSIEKLEERIILDIKQLDEKITYQTYQAQQFEICSRHYSNENYKENIRKFYQGLFTFS